MQEDLDYFIKYCQEPSPAFAGDTHAIGFHLTSSSPTEDGFPYNGLLFFKPLVGMHPFVLTGFGYSENIALNSATAPLVRIDVLVGRNDVIETGLNFCERDYLGGPGTVIRSEDCDVSVQVEGDFRILLFTGGSVGRRASMFGTNVLHSVAGTGQSTGDF